MSTNVSQTLSFFIDLLTKQQIDYALIGGLAAGYWGKERFTKDIDFTLMLNQQKWGSFEKELKTNPDIEIDTIAKDEGDPIPYLVRIQYKNYPIDLIVALTDYQESLLARAISTDLMNQKIKIASPEDLIISKLIAHRGQDLVDAKDIMKHVDQLDRAYIEKWVKVWEVEKYWKDLQTKK